MKRKDALKHIIYFSAITLSIVYLIWRVFFTLPLQYGVVAIIAGTLLWIAELIGIIGGIGQLWAMEDEQYPPKPDVPKEWYPDVDVFIATHNEPYELLYKTINGCINMDYPDMSKVHIYICDDTNRKEIQDLAAKMKVGYFGLSDNQAAKAGNLNNAIAHTKSPIIATFDADMIPMHNFLMNTVPYFFLPQVQEDEELKIGFIQTPQSFYNTDLFQYNIYSEDKVPNEQNFFFREVNVGRNRNNTPIYAGSNTLILREALSEVGGIAEGLITEDFATGMEIQAKGYRCYAIKEVGANGLAPNDLKSLIKQRERWARGCIQTVRKARLVTRRDLKFKQKISYMSSLLYWYTPLCRMMYVLAPTLFVLFDIKFVDYNLSELLLFWAPYYFLYTYALKMASGNTRTARLSNIYDTIMFPYLIGPVVLETLGFKKKKFVVTVKDNSMISNHNIKYAVPHLICTALLIGALLKCLFNMVNTYSSYQLIILGWLLVNLHNSVMAVFFVLGRKIERQSERIYANIDISIFLDHKTIKAKTNDLADGSLSIILDFPEYIAPGKLIKMVCVTSRYSAEFKAKIVHVNSVKNKWKYAFLIEKINEENLRNYYGMIYDREPYLPQTVSRKSGTFNDLSNNIHRRLSKKFSNNRKLARMSLEKKLMTKTGKEVILYDFNYEYMLVGCLDKPPFVEVLLGEGISIKGILEGGTSFNRGEGISTTLYKVDNLQELQGNQQLNILLAGWAKAYEEECFNRSIKQKQLAEDQQDELDEWEVVWREGEKDGNYPIKKDNNVNLYF